MSNAASEYQIPFNRSQVVGNELNHIEEAIGGGQIGGNQRFSRRSEDLLQEVIGCKRSLLTTSCTHALEMAAILLEIREGDEVIVPTFTFVSTANAFVMRGAKPVFCDIRPDTLNLDEGKLESIITPRTRAIVVVHYSGVGCEMDAIMEIAGRHGLVVVEDNAHGLFAKYKGRTLGTFGALSAQSFHETKNITCGEGGALLLNEDQYIQRAEIIREKGTDRTRFFRGQVDKYTWVDLGSSYVMSDVLAAFLFGQLEKWNLIQSLRSDLWRRYHAELQDWSLSHEIRQPFVPDYCEQSWHMYYLLMPSNKERSRFIKHLARQNILAVFHYIPLHLSDYAKRWKAAPGDHPVAEAISDRLVRLPFYTTMSHQEQTRVIEACRSYVTESRAN